MANFIKRLSSMVSRTGIFSRRRLALNENAAREIQKLVFEKRTSKKSDNTNPPYKKILNQLDDKNDQVFFSAVYYLSKIALSSSKYHKEIENVLVQHSQKAHLTIKRKDYLLKKIAEIKNSAN